MATRSSGEDGKAGDISAREAALGAATNEDRVDMLKGRTIFVGLELNSPDEEVVRTQSARLTLILSSRRQIPT
jgi:hypothetical protein